MPSNGCGPAWLPQLFKRLLFDWFFEASCNKHDEGYERGGDEVRRFECDWKFWQAMRRDTLRFKGIKRGAAWLCAVAFFVIVRAGGWSRFNYDNPTD